MGWTSADNPARQSGRGLALAALLAFCADAAGCATRNVIHPQNMSSDLVAAPVENPQMIDLSRLAKYSGNSEIIERGDLIEVTIRTGYSAEEDSKNGNTMPVRVAEDGSINVPPIGRVVIAGLEPDDAERAIATAGVTGGFYRNPNVTVAMRTQRVNRVTVVGAVESPGVVELPRRSSSLLSALVEAGGLSKDAGVDIEIRRGEAESTGGRPGDRDRTASGGGAERVGFNQPQSASSPAVHINLVSAAREGNGGYSLDDGDVVMVAKRDVPPIQVLGLVAKAGQFEMPPNKDVHTLDALALAGGLSTPWADKVHIIRQRFNGEPAIIEVSLKEAKSKGLGNMRLAPGDVVSVEQTPTTVCMEALKNLAHFSLGASVPVFR